MDEVGVRHKYLEALPTSAELVHVGVSLIAVPQLVRQHAAPTKEPSAVGAATCPGKLGGVAACFLTAHGLTAILLRQGCTRLRVARAGSESHPSLCCHDGYAP